MSLHDTVRHMERQLAEARDVGDYWQRQAERALAQVSSQEALQYAVRDLKGQLAVATGKLTELERLYEKLRGEYAGACHRASVAESYTKRLETELSRVSLTPPKHEFTLLRSRMNALELELNKSEARALDLEQQNAALAEALRLARKGGE